MVVTNQIAGYLYHPDTQWLKTEEVRFKTDGLVLAKRIPNLSEREDCLFHLGNFDP